jgi:hypothetical protein
VVVIKSAMYVGRLISLPRVELVVAAEHLFGHFKAGHVHDLDIT